MQAGHFGPVAGSSDRLPTQDSRLLLGTDRKVRRMSTFSPQQIRHLAAHPHLIGHMVGKTKLVELHSTWIRQVWLADFHSALMAHRGGYKTTAITEVGTLWWLLFHPDDRIALLRETHSAACDTLKTIAQYFENELVQELFYDIHGRYPRAVVDRADRLVFDFKGSVTKEGNLDAYGIDTVPTGSHYDLILPDDVVTIKDRFSRAKRERTKLNLQEIITNILDPGKFLRMVGTPWHADDAWQMDGIPAPWRYSVHETGILTPKQIEEKRKTTSRALFSINYELNHITDDDAMFKEPTFAPWDKKRLRNIQAHVDARFKGSHFTALTIMGQRHDGRYQVWGKSYDRHVKDVVDDILGELASHEALVLHIEDNPDKGWAADLFRRGGSGRWRAPVVYDYHESMNKQKKIEGYISDFWTRLVFDEDCEEEWCSQVFDYRGEEPDDAPDSLSSLIRQGYHETDALTSTSNILNQE